MIFIGMKDGSTLIILEPGNIERMRDGKPLISPDNRVMVAFTPDMEWTQDRIMEMLRNAGGKVDPKLVDDILRAGLNRPVVIR